MRGAYVSRNLHLTDPCENLGKGLILFSLMSASRRNRLGDIIACSCADTCHSDTVELWVVILACFSPVLIVCAFFSQIPVVSTGNVGQLAVDLFLSSGRAQVRRRGSAQTDNKSMLFHLDFVSSWYVRSTPPLPKDECVISMNRQPIIFPIVQFLA